MFSGFIAIGMGRIEADAFGAEQGVVLLFQIEQKAHLHEQLFALGGIDPLAATGEITNALAQVADLGGLFLEQGL